MIEYITINEHSATPKYMQLANSIVGAIKNRSLVRNDILPSINYLCENLELSRDSIVRAYNYLRSRNVIDARPGKGFYVRTTEVIPRFRVGFFLNRMSAHKKLVYDAFMAEIAEDAVVDVFVYNSDIDLLKRLLTEAVQQYDYYIIFPHFRALSQHWDKVLGQIPSAKLLFLGRVIPDLPHFYGAVLENHQDDIYRALKEARHELNKYHSLKLIFPDGSDYPRAIIKGFYRFCSEFSFKHELVTRIKSGKLKQGQCYINLADDYLPVLLDKAVKSKLLVGYDLGIIAYNETALKKYILNGLTTISTDFQFMGTTAAKLIKSETGGIYETPFRLIKRGSV